MTTEIAWAAGFFDGEGNVATKIVPRAMQMRIQITQVDPRPLYRFAEAVGDGTVYGPYQNSHWSPQYKYCVTSHDRVKSVIEKLLPYLSEPKKEQAMSAFRKWDERPLVREGCRTMVRRVKK